MNTDNTASTTQTSAADRVSPGQEVLILFSNTLYKNRRWFSFVGITGLIFSLLQLALSLMQEFLNPLDIASSALHLIALGILFKLSNRIKDCVNSCSYDKVKQTFASIGKFCAATLLARSVWLVMALYNSAS